MALMHARRSAEALAIRLGRKAPGEFRFDAAAATVASDRVTIRVLDAGGAEITYEDGAPLLARTVTIPSGASYTSIVTVAHALHEMR